MTQTSGVKSFDNPLGIRMTSPVRGRETLYEKSKSFWDKGYKRDRYEKTHDQKEQHELEIK